MRKFRRRATICGRPCWKSRGSAVPMDAVLAAYDRTKEMGKGLRIARIVARAGTSTLAHLHRAAEISATTEDLAGHSAT